MAVSDTLAPSQSQARLDEFARLISSAAVYALNHRAKLSLTGKDRVRWLNGMITNNVRDLALGQGVYAFLLTPQGKILGDLYAYRRGESLLLDTERAQLPKILETLKRYIIMDKVEIAEDPLAAIGIAGPRAAEALRALGLQEAADASPDKAAQRDDQGFDFATMTALQLIELTADSVPVTVVRGDNPLVPTYELWIAPAHLPGLKSALATREVSCEAVELLRVASGVPRYGQDIRDHCLAQETGQVRALSFTKGCYIGQEIVERIRARGNVHRMFTGFQLEGGLPLEGTKIQAEGKEVGEITSVATLPTGGVALGFLRREAAAKELTAGTARLKVAGLPFENILAS